MPARCFTPRAFTLAAHDPTSQTAEMHRGTLFGLLLLLGALLFQVWVTIRLRRTQIFDVSQKRAQTKLIWLLPVVGAAIVFSVLVSEEQYESKDERGQSG
jgi:hypothetical protein